MKKTLILLFVGGLGASLCLPLGRASAAPPNAAKAFGTAIADVVDKVMPAVVVVRTEAMKYRLARDVFFGQVYRVPERLAGQGSGVVIDKEGHVLTNNHVIDDAQNIEVVFNDGTKYPAKLVGTDPHTDLAVLRIDAPAGKTFQPVEQGDSDALRVGEFVIALGSPFSLSSSVTLGIVSQKGRAIGLLPYEDFIQTDAAVNRGNSGGPLCDMDGRMVGINTVIQTSGMSEGNIGISFAVPVNLARGVAESILKTGKWERPWIGVVMNDAPEGVQVEQVVPDSPAGRVGLRVGDTILSVDGAAVDGPRDVQRMVMKRQAGEIVSLTVRRDGVEKVFKLPTAAIPAPSFFYRE